MMKESEAKMMRGLLPYLILKCGEVQPFHGYQLIRVMREKFGVYFGPSTVYPLLKLLESEGFLISRWETKGINGVQRPRKIYTITNSGLEVMQALTSTMQAVSTFQGQMPQAPTKPERHNIIILER